MGIKIGELEALAQEKIDSDTDFQASLETLSDDEKNQALSDKKQELIDSELAAMEEKASKAEKNYESQKIRAEKAEALAKGAKPEKETPKNDNLSLKDIRALQDVDDEDVDEVLNFAKFKGISVAEAKASPVIQTLLKTNVETRKTAQATQVKNSGRSSSKTNDEKVLEDFSNGIAPEDPEALAKARYNAILKKRKN
jgi:hypothetical protein